MKNLLLCVLALTVLAFTARAAQIHVAKTGSDGNSGTSGSPYLTINKAAQMAQPGDSVIVHAGEYHEQVSPLNGGTGETSRITYCNATGDKPVIKGSERITTWVSQGGGVWKVDLNTSFFGSFNPYTQTVNCGAYMTYGQWHHCGDLYLNGIAFVEQQAQSSTTTQNTWFTSTTGSTTSIWANFGTVDPNSAVTEINVREMCIAPAAFGKNYITIHGLTLMHAATSWASNGDCNQDGLICTMTGDHWIIENCTLANSRCCGIAIGTWTGAPRATASSGHHVIRNNVIRHCGETSVVGSNHNYGTQIIGNLIEYINDRNEFGGWETAGIKMHNAVDIVIANNLIRSVRGDAGNYGIWLDWSWQNARISGNVFAGIQGTALQMEEGFGPHLFDNNVFIGSGIGSYSSEAAVVVHNLFYNCNGAWAEDDSRSPNWWTPHTINSAGSKLCPPSVDRWYNNIFVSAGMQGATNSSFKLDYNVYLQGAGKSPFDANSVVNSFSTAFNLKNDSSGVSISFNMDSLPWTVLTPLITTAYIGPIAACGRGPENADASPITVDKDFFGNARNTTHPLPGPFEKMVKGANTFQLFTLYNDNLTPTGIAGSTPSITGSRAAEASIGKITRMQNSLAVDLFVPGNATVDLAVFDLKGRSLIAPVHKGLTAGINHVTLPVTISNSGACILRVTTNGRSAVKKIVS